MANKILKLLDEQFVFGFFEEKILPLYPDFLTIKKIEITPRKKHIWEHTYHVVIEYKTSFINKNKELITIPIFVAAHSSEPRKNVYDALKFLWENNFGNGDLTIPHPLFYSEEFRGTFYRGVEGHHLYYYIKNKDYKNIEAIIPRAAAWFAKLHNLKINGAKNFNEENSLIKTAIPGVGHILEKIHERYPEYYEFCKKVYGIIIAEEEKFLNSTKARWLIHGDAHPENIIKMSENTLAAIDFSDLCLSDFARDIGSFMQQVEYMSNRKIGNTQYSTKLKNLFLEKYLENAKIKLDSGLKKRIDNYYIWTAMRTATFFLTKEIAQPDRAESLFQSISKKLKI